MNVDDNRSLRGVRERLEIAVQRLPGTPTNPLEEFERRESVAIAILDAEFGDFEPGLLEEFLQQYLFLQRMELGLEPYFQE